MIYTAAISCVHHEFSLGSQQPHHLPKKKKKSFLKQEDGILMCSFYAVETRPSVVSNLEAIAIHPFHDSTQQLLAFWNARTPRQPYVKYLGNPCCIPCLHNSQKLHTTFTFHVSISQPRSNLEAKCTNIHQVQQRENTISRWPPHQTEFPSLIKLIATVNRCAVLPQTLTGFSLW